MVLDVVTLAEFSGAGHFEERLKFEVLRWFRLLDGDGLLVGLMHALRAGSGGLYPPPPPTYY